MTIDPRQIATNARRQLRELDRTLAGLDIIADDGPRAIQAIHDMLPCGPATGNPDNPTPPPTTNDEDAGHSIHSDPTGAAGTGDTTIITTWTKTCSNLLAIEHITRYLNRMVTAVNEVSATVTEYGAAPIDTETRTELADINRRDGLCPCCETTWTTGKGDDRLRLTTLGDDHQPVLMCDPCRKAWDRRPSDDFQQRETYPNFRQRRRKETRRKNNG